MPSNPTADLHTTPQGLAIEAADAARMVFLTAEEFALAIECGALDAIGRAADGSALVSLDSVLAFLY
jgi:hypothetical protein